MPTCLARLRRAIAALLLVPLAVLAAPGVPPQAPSGWRIPGSFEPVGALWLGFDAGHAEWTAQLVQAFAPHVKLKMLVASTEVEQQARATLFDHGVAVDDISFHVEPLAPFFLQDAAVFAIGPGGRLGVVDFAYTAHGLPAWCAKRHGDDVDARDDCAGHAGPSGRAREVLDRSIAAFGNASVIDSALALEGGGVEVNGQGLMIVNEALLASRNPGMDRAAMQAALLALPGVRKLIWLPQGLAEDAHLRSTVTGRHVAWGTGGHTDQFVRFADARTVLLAWVDEAEAARHPVARLNRQRMQRNFEILSRATDAQGRPLRVLKVPLPRLNERAVVLREDADTAFSDQWRPQDFPPHERRREGDTVLQVAPSSYLNYVAANGVVVLPDYLRAGTAPALQRRVRQLFERAFPGRRIVFVDSMAANWYAGGPHCATLSEPARP